MKLHGRTFTIIYFVGLIIGAVIRGVYTKGTRQNIDKEQGKVRLILEREGSITFFLMLLWGIGSQIIPLLYMLTHKLDFADYRLSKKAEAWTGRIGTVTFGIGLWLLWRSHADLGPNWSPTTEIKEDHKLVTDGAYRYIRHPMYAAHGLWGIAQALLLQNWIAGLGSLAPLVPLYLMRIPKEEGMMLDEFGGEYRSYMDRTGRVFPRV